MTYTLKLYRQRPGCWSYTLANSVGGSTSEGTFRTRGSILNMLAFRRYDPKTITAVEDYHWTGADYILKQRKDGGA